MPSRVRLSRVKPLYTMNFTNELHTKSMDHKMSIECFRRLDLTWDRNQHRTNAWMKAIGSNCKCSKLLDPKLDTKRNSSEAHAMNPSWASQNFVFLKLLFLLRYKQKSIKNNWRQNIKNWSSNIYLFFKKLIDEM